MKKARKLCIFYTLIVFFSTAQHRVSASAPPTAPFNTPENHSRDLSAFYKWTDLLRRMDRDEKAPEIWRSMRSILLSVSENDLIRIINDTVNQSAYLPDIETAGKNDHWKTPREFFSEGGGDCEDFAIAKYAWLRFQGIEEERLRIAIVHDLDRDVPHALLIVYINGVPMLMDSRLKSVTNSLQVEHYKIQYSINRTGWWYPSSQMGRYVLADKNLE